MEALKEKSGDSQAQYDSSSGEHTKFCSNPFNTCWDISDWTKGVDRETDRPAVSMVKKLKYKEQRNLL